MLRLIYFHLASVFTKVSTIVVAVTGWVASFAAVALLTNDSPTDYINNKWIILPVFFFFSMVSTIMSSVTIFKESKETGVQALLYSKPYNKMHHLGAQMATNIILLTAYSVVLFFVAGFSLLTGETSAVWTKAISVAVGNFVIMMIFGTIISVSSLWLPNFWTTAVWTMLAVFMPVFSTIMQNHQNTSFSGVSSAKYSVAHEDGGELMWLDSAEDNIYLDQRDSHQLPNIAQQLQFAEHEDNAYESIAWVDPWYQLSTLYTMFDDNEIDEELSSWEESTVAVSDLEGLTFNLNGVDYKVLVKQVTRIDTYQSQARDVIGDASLTAALQSREATISALSFERQLALMQYIVRASEQDRIGELDNNIAKVSVMDWDDALREANAQALFMLQHYMDEGIFTSSSTDISLTDEVEKSMRYDIMLLDNSVVLKTFEPNKFIDTEWVVLIWTLTLAVVATASTYIFYKKNWARN